MCFRSDSKPPLVRHPLIVSGYANPHRNLSLKEAVQNLLGKKAVEMVRVRASLAFFNRLFIVPEPNQKWWPVLDLSALNKFLSVKHSKWKPQRQFGFPYNKGNGCRRWISAMPISTFQFTPGPGSISGSISKTNPTSSGPFGLSTAPMEFTCVVKVVKLMAQSRGIRIHQYLDHWLIRAPTKESCHQGTQSLLALCQELRGEPTKVRVGTQTDFRVCGLQVRSLKGWSNRPITVGS